MGKLIFIWGTMGAAKTANALMQYYELQNRQGKKVELWKPSTDVRDGLEVVKSRIGLEAEAHILQSDESFISKNDNNNNIKGEKKIIIFDEAQFCTEKQISELKDLTVDLDYDIYCYGLKTDFTTHLFEGSKRLLEVADDVRKLEMSCCECGRDAEVNARMVNGEVTTHGEQIQIGANESYKALCYKCWKKHLTKINKCDII